MLDPRTECVCDISHSIVKLGHCADCPWYKPDQLTELKPELLRGHLGCPPQHSDGTPHNFDWATYCDDTMSHGVCVCGMTGVDDSIWYGP